MPAQRPLVCVGLIRIPVAEGCEACNSDLVTVASHCAFAGVEMKPMLPFAQALVV